jgi:hypothetical protein
MDGVAGARGDAWLEEASFEMDSCGRAGGP